MRFNLATKKARVGFFQIFVLILGTISFSYFVGGVGLASFASMWGAEDWTMICGKIAGGDSGMDISAVQTLSKKEMLIKYEGQCDTQYPPSNPQMAASNKECKAEAATKITDGISGNEATPQKVTPKSVVDQCKNNPDALSKLGDSDFLKGAQENLDRGLNSNVKDEITKRIQSTAGDGKFSGEFNLEKNSGIRNQWMKGNGLDFKGIGDAPTVTYENGKYTFGMEKTGGGMNLDSVELSKNGIQKFDVEALGKKMEINTADLGKGANVLKTSNGNTNWVDLNDISKVKVDDRYFSSLDKLQLRENGFSFSGQNAQVVGPDSFKLVNYKGQGVSVTLDGSPATGMGDGFSSLNSPAKDFSTFRVDSSGKLTEFNSFGTSRVSYQGSLADGFKADFTGAKEGFFSGKSSLNLRSLDGKVSILTKGSVIGPENAWKVMGSETRLNLVGGEKSLCYCEYS